MGTGGLFLGSYFKMRDLKTLISLGTGVQSYFRYNNTVN